MSIVGSFRQLAGNALDYGSSMFNLPEWNLSERLAGGKTMFTNAFKPNAAYAAEPAKNTTSGGYNPYMSTGQNMSYGSTKGIPIVDKGPGINNNGTVLGTNNNNNTNNNSNNNDLDRFNQLIDSDYEAAMGNIGQQETGLRSQADTATAGAVADYGSTKTAIGNEQATKEAGITQQEQVAQTGQTNAIRQARDLFRETQQANNAQMSGLGISSSSVTEALAEKLGVETARRIAGVTGSTQEILQNLAAERTRTQTFFKEKLTNLEEKLNVVKRGIQDALMAGLQQLNNARTLAAADKANRRAELLSNAQQAQYNAQLEAQKFQQALTMWNEQKNTALAQANQFLINPTDFSAQADWINKTQTAIPGIPGYDTVPTMEPTSTGYLKPSYQYKKINEDDELANPFGTGA